MKRRTLLILFAATAAALLIARFIWPIPQTTPPNSVRETVAEAPNPAVSTQTETDNRTTAEAQRWRGENVPGTEGNWALEPLPPGRNLQERLEELARRRGVPLNVLTQQALAQWSNVVQEMSQEVNRAIDFYGQAVDENGLPVKGASVRFSCVIFPENHFATNVLSDAQGKFALAGVTGAILNVQVSKDGYEELQGTNQNSFTYSSSVGGGFNADPTNPVIFHLRKKE